MTNWSQNYDFFMTFNLLCHNYDLSHNFYFLCHNDNFMLCIWLLVDNFTFLSLSWFGNGLPRSRLKLLIKIFHGFFKLFLLNKVYYSTFVTFSYTLINISVLLQWILLHSVLSASRRCLWWVGVFSCPAGGAGCRQRVPAAGLHVHLLPPTHAPDGIWSAHRCHLPADGACRRHLPSIYSAQVRLKTKADKVVDTEHWQQFAVKNVATVSVSHEWQCYRFKQSSTLCQQAAMWCNN